MKLDVYYLAALVCLASVGVVSGRSVIIANYHNVIMFFPKELGGNDDVRVVFDVRNVTEGTFKYLPVVVAVEYDTRQNNAYLYLESAITSYIMLLQWSGGRWCYQVLFEFPSSQFSKFMYHSIILWKNYIYWTTDRYIMSGRLPGYEKRLLLQPAWNQLYSMALDKENEQIYVAGFDYTENALFSCSLRYFSCDKVIKTQFTLNYIYFNVNTLFVASIDRQAIFKLGTVQGFSYLKQVTQLNSNIANLLVIDDSLALYTDQQVISIVTDYNSSFPRIRQADAHLIDPYALQYVFSFNKIFDFDGYPYPYQFSDYHSLLYKNNLYIFYFYVCGMKFIESDLLFLPQMDLNNQFLSLESCADRFYQDRLLYIIPVTIACAGVAIIVIASLIVLCWRMRCCSKLGCGCQKNKTKSGSKRKASAVARNKQVQMFDDLSMAVSESRHSPPLSVRYGQWIGSIKENATNNEINTVTMQGNYPHLGLINLNNLDVLEDQPVYNYNHQSLMFQQPQARYGNITNQRFEGAKQQDDLTSLSSMASSSSVSSSSISSVTQQQNNKGRQFNRQAKTGEALKSGRPNASSQVALNETYVNYIESLKASNKTRSPNDTVLTHPSAYSVFSATSVETQPAARSQKPLPLDASAVQKQFQDLSRNISQRQHQPQQQQQYISSTERIQLNSRSDPVYTVPPLATFNTGQQHPKRTKTPEPRPRQSLSKSNSISGDSTPINNNSKIENKSLVNKLAEKIQQLPNITNSANFRSTAEVGSSPVDETTTKQTNGAATFQSTAIHRRSSYLSILKADLMDDDYDNPANYYNGQYLEQRIRI